MSQNKGYVHPDAPFHYEKTGLEHVPDEERHRRPRELFWLWFASDISPYSIIYGAILFAAGLTLLQSGIVAVLAIASSFALVAVLSLASVRTGVPMLATSRAAFGSRGNLGPALVSWLNLVGWEVFSTTLATDNLDRCGVYAGWRGLHPVCLDRRVLCQNRHTQKRHHSHWLT